jgi:hypothetical protein
MIDSSGLLFQLAMNSLCLTRHASRCTRKSASGQGRDRNANELDRRTV